ncbi:hypothetical protein [Paenibacillus dendritiformis]|uniref:hypothetical protein n=1 Tax=Paenibacillus dendritiformis TaxID=130049 RepID=UPI0015EBDCCC|nr:hypothetical protein [Paenibacillus dendritiformis]
MGGSVQNNRCLPGIERFRETITYSLQPDLLSIASGLFCWHEPPACEVAAGRLDCHDY